MKRNRNNTIKNELLKVLVESYKTNEEIKKHCDEVIKKKQNEMMLNPVINIQKWKSPENDNYYLYSRSRIPIGVEKYKTLKGYIGKLSDFPNGTKDVDAYKIGQDVMRKRIKQYLGEKELNNKKVLV